MRLKRTVTLLSLVFIFSGCSLLEGDKQRGPSPAVKDVPFQARENDELKKRLVVLPFLGYQLQTSNNVTEIARRAVVEDLVETKNFIVINNADLGKDPQSFVSENKEYDMVVVSRLASQVGATAVVEGRILEIKARRMGDEIGLFRKTRAQADVAIQIRVYGAKTAREVLNTVRKVTVEVETTRLGEGDATARSLQEDPALVRSGVRKAFKESVGAIARSIEKLSWEGKVALVSGEKIYVNAGRLSGIQVGDILKITEEGDEVFDPNTGSFIGEAPGRLKGTVEVVSYFGKDGSIAIVHSGSGFKENDRVELY